MKKIIPILLLGFSAMLQAQNSVSGTVTDAQNQPLKGVTITAPEIHKGTTTDENGKYTLNNLPNGNLKLSFSFIGFAVQNKTISLQQKETTKPSKATISNAMDVGNPSNFIRIQELYHNDLNAFKKDFTSFSYDDDATKQVLKEIYKNSGYIAEPHGAVGYLGLKKEMQNHPNAIGIFLETAHPIKFLDVVEPVLGIQLPIPTQIESVLNKEKVSVKIKTYDDLKSFLEST
jgi:hypothetical protein